MPMAYEQKDMSGSLLPNENKQGDNDPAYRGSAKIDGVEHWVSMWKKTSKNGKVYLSLRFKPKHEQAGARASLKEELRDEVPW